MIALPHETYSETDTVASVRRQIAANLNAIAEGLHLKSLTSAQAANMLHAEARKISP
jgi:hypothetical protein